MLEEVEIAGILYRSQDQPGIVYTQMFPDIGARDAQLARDIAAPGKWIEITPFDRLARDSPYCQIMRDIYGEEFSKRRIGERKRRNPP